MNKFLILFLKGIFVGIANIIPGVSGSTIAIVLRIFDQLIDSINNFFKNPKKYIKFLTPIILGAVIGVFSFSSLLKICLEKDSFATTLFFMGLVIGSIPLIYNQTKKRQSKPWYFLISVLTFGIVALISLMKEPTSTSNNFSLTTSYILQIFIGGVVSSASMIIPGISGSFVLILLGMYNTILTSISELFHDGINLISSGDFLNGFIQIIKSNNFIITLIFGIGVVVGIVLISKFIAILLKKAFSATYFAILGLIFGSIFSTFNSAETYQSHNGGIPGFSIFLGIILLIIGIFIALKLGKED